MVNAVARSRSTAVNKSRGGNLKHSSWAHAYDSNSLCHVLEAMGSANMSSDVEEVKTMVIHTIFGWHVLCAVFDRLRMWHNQGMEPTNVMFKNIVLDSITVRPCALLLLFDSVSR